MILVTLQIKVLVVVEKLFALFAGRSFPGKEALDQPLHHFLLSRLHGPIQTCYD
jgi:hypothetical protein